MTAEQSARGGIEAAVFVFALAMAAEVLLRAVPGLNAYPVDTVAVVRVGLFALACFGAGFWIQRRYTLPIPLAAMSFGVGVAASFLIRALREGSDASTRTEELVFTAGLAFANWAVLLIGAVLSKWRSL
jgi:hypothetical protein